MSPAVGSRMRCRWIAGTSRPRSRAITGAQRPTKPIGPASVTEAAVSMTARTVATARVEGTGTLQLAYGVLLAVGLALS